MQDTEASQKEAPIKGAAKVFTLVGHAYKDDLAIVNYF